MLLSFRIPAGVLVLAVLTAWAFWLPSGVSGGRDFAISLVLGGAFGIVLQRARFCFLCNFRDFVQTRDPRGLISILIALGIGAAGYAAVFGAWMPVPVPDRLPPDAHIGPVSWMLAVSAFVFGLGMAISGSCLSAHLYRLGEGSPTAPFAIVGAAIGFALGFLSWNFLFLLVLSGARPIWLPHHLGYAGTLIVTLALLAGLAMVLLWRGRIASAPDVSGSPNALFRAARRLFVERWPASVGGLLIGMIGTLAYLRVAPLGVTAELGSLARTAAFDAGLLPETLFGLDGFSGCVTAVKQVLLSKNGVFVLGLVGGSFAAALIADQFKPEIPKLGHIVNGLTGGILMGWGAMTALGCTIGVLLSGIQAGSLSGWIFLFCCGAGVYAGLKLKARA